MQKMNYRKLKFEYVLVFIISSIISGVLLWFILDYFNIETSIEISVLIVIALISGVIIYNLHDRGLLPQPVYGKTADSEKTSGRYNRKRYRPKDFTRVGYHITGENQRKAKSSQSDKRIQYFQYQRPKYRN
ncbi:MAG: hypothetical protein KAQ95_12905 [Candidatus Heimdallarchaeota archaeon]|nr:hypothetical protein [Candidatus Heimdallarchaeota archaeon]